MRPSISIVIASKDRAGYVQRALQSLVAQQGAPQFEVIVVDNASSDATPQIVQAARLQVPYALTYVHEPIPNRGKARNRGVAQARGDLILFVDDDVWMPPGFVHGHAAGQERRRGVVTGPIINVPSYAAHPRPNPRNYSNAFFCTCNVSLPKSSFEEVGGFDEEFPLYGWEDTELGLRLRERGHKRMFSWSAYLYHIKPPAEATLEATLAKTVEKAHMAARFIRKHPDRRVRLAAGAYPLNYLRVRAIAPSWLLPLYAGALERHVVPPVFAGFIRKQLIDGVYVRELSAALTADPPPN